MTEQELRDAIRPCILAGNTWFVHEQINSYAAAQEEKAVKLAVHCERENLNRVIAEKEKQTFVKALRSLTGCSSDDCRTALEANHWDCYNAAIKLRSNGPTAKAIIDNATAEKDAEIRNLKSYVAALESDNANHSMNLDHLDGEVSRLKAENERLREGIKRVVASNSSHPWSAIDREDLIEDVHQMNAVLKSLLSPAPENPEVDEFPCPNCMNTPSGKVACLYNCKIKGQ